MAPDPKLKSTSSKLVMSRIETTETSAKRLATINLVVFFILLKWVYNVKFLEQLGLPYGKAL
jgi:hypothetical protein